MRLSCGEAQLVAKDRDGWRSMIDALCPMGGQGGWGEGEGDAVIRTPQITALHLDSPWAPLRSWGFFFTSILNYRPVL